MTLRTGVSSIPSRFILITIQCLELLCQSFHDLCVKPGDAGLGRKKGGRREDPSLSGVWEARGTMAVCACAGRHFPQPRARVTAPFGKRDPVYKAKWLPWSRLALAALLLKQCLRRPPDGTRGSQTDPVALLGPPWAPAALPLLASCTQCLAGLGVEARPSDHGWTIATVQTEAGGRELGPREEPKEAPVARSCLARCPGVGRPWPLDSGLQSCGHTGRAAGSSTHAGPQGGPACSGL